MAGGALAAEQTGDGDRIVLVHGFTQTGRCWGDIVRRLGADHRVVAVDAPGHGGSSEARADLWETAELLAATGGPATYLGYSMGGRMALHTALARPSIVERLVLVSATAGIEDEIERAVRRRADDELAARIEEVGVDAFVDEWLAGPLFATLPSEAQDRSERRRNTAAGLASSLRLAGTGTQGPLWPRLGELSMPVLVVSGSLDERFSRLAARMVDSIGDNARWVLLSGGHTVHRESPAFVDTLASWLAETA